MTVSKMTLTCYSQNFVTSRPITSGRAFVVMLSESIISGSR
jgi:hypothetical protein